MAVAAHRPVLLEEALVGLNIEKNGIYVDGTFGRGGHATEILKRLGEQGHLLAIDKDPEAVAVARERFSDDRRFSIEHGSFAMLKNFVQVRNWAGKVNGVLLDLGVSSPQLDDSQRGFSFMNDGPLDMRMDPGQGMSAATWLNHAGAQEIAAVLKEYGEERYAWRIARAIVGAREQTPFTRTLQLAEVIAGAAPKKEQGKHPATRSFQAIRIFINKELDDLRVCLDGVLDVLAPGGRLAVISFHSLEDRLVKRFIRTQERRDDLPPDLPLTHDQIEVRMFAVGKPKHASPQEIEDNVRSRSAVLRVAEKAA